MSHLLMVALMIPVAFQEPAKTKPEQRWLPLLEGDEFKEDCDTLIEAAPKAIDEFEAIINDPSSLPIHVGRLYGVIMGAKVDRKRFLKPALRDLNHEDANVRFSAALFVGRVGGGPEFSAPLLILALHDPKAEVSIAAMGALGKVGDGATVVALEHLIRFGYGKQDTPERAKAVAKAFGDTRDQIKVRLAAAAKVPAPPK